MYACVYLRMFVCMYVYLHDCNVSNVILVPSLLNICTRRISRLESENKCKHYRGIFSFGLTPDTFSFHSSLVFVKYN